MQKVLKEEGGDSDFFTGSKLAQTGDIIFNDVIIGSFVNSCVLVPNYDQTSFDDNCDMFLTFNQNIDGFATVALDGLIPYEFDEGDYYIDDGRFKVQGAGGDFVNRYNGYMYTVYHGEPFAEAYLYLTEDTAIEVPF